MNGTVIFYPVFALVFLNFILLGRLGFLRIRAIAANRELIKYYIDYRGDEEPLHIRLVSRNLCNLLELPVLFYVGAIIAYVSGQVSTVLLTIAWGYVILRYIHSWIHTSGNHVPTRFKVFAVSVVLLFAFWVVLMLSVLGPI